MTTVDVAFSGYSDVPKLIWLVNEESTVIAFVTSQGTNPNLTAAVNPTTLSFEDVRLMVSIWGPLDYALCRLLPH